MDEVELERPRFSAGDGRCHQEEAEGEDESRKPFRQAGRFESPVRVSLDSVQIKRPCRLPFVPGFEARTRKSCVRISILMVNHSLLKSKCGKTMAISRQKYRSKFMVNGILWNEAYAVLAGQHPSPLQGAGRLSPHPKIKYPRRSAE
jgi:hypothetical protein